MRMLTGLASTQISDMQVAELLHALDANGDGVISYEEFVNGFRLVDEGAPRQRGSGGGGGGGGAAANQPAAGGGKAPAAAHAPHASPARSPVASITPPSSPVARGKTAPAPVAHL